MAGKYISLKAASALTPYSQEYLSLLARKGRISAKKINRVWHGKKEDILKLGGYWEDINESHINGMATSELPDNIKDVPDEIVTQALVCPETGWRFNISKNELAFHKANNIPLPRVHFDVRIMEKMKL